MILIVDDKPENIFSLKKVLQLNNFEVDTALSGEEALKKILKYTYALIILDVQMPGMDGFEVAEAVSGYSKSKDVPIIFLSAASIEKQFIKKGYASGAIDYVTKPVDPDILLLKVKTFYRIYEQNRALTEVHNVLREEIEFRKLAQDELKARVGELKSILESLPQIAFTAKNDGELEFVNQHWFAYSDSERVIPANYEGSFDIESEWRAAVKAGKALESEVTLQRLSDGKLQCHLLRVIPIKSGDSIIKWVGTFTNIEEQKQGEKRKDEFLSIASHELKTPLTSIKAYVQLLERSLKKSESYAGVSGYIDRTRLQLEKLNGLVADLLDVSKIESGKLQFAVKEFDFSTLLDATIDIFTQTNPDIRILKKSISNAKVLGDEMRIEQVLINYLSNAIKYSPNAKEVEVSSKIVGGHLICTVVDTGVGIPEEKQKDIFNKYYRVEENSVKFQGLGIGLYICSEIIKRHHGTVGVNSTPGKGSEFYFTLPLSK